MGVGFQSSRPSNLMVGYCINYIELTLNNELNEGGNDMGFGFGGCGGHGRGNSWCIVIIIIILLLTCFGDEDSCSC